MNISENADQIENLPINNSLQPTPNEIRIVNTLFVQNASTVDKIVEEVKDLIFLGAIFIVVSMPITDTFIRKFIPITQNSDYFLILAKAFLLMLLYWVVKNFWLCRKKT